MTGNASLTSSFVADVDSLAGYAPRNRAIELIRAGRVEEYLDWALSDCKEAATGKAPTPATEQDRRRALIKPMALDIELMRVRLPGKYSRGLDAAARNAALDAVEHFGQAPLEIALRSASDAAFEKCLDAWCLPRRRFADGFGELDGFRWSEAGPKRSKLDALYDASMELSHGNGGSSHWGLLSLSFLIGKPERAEMMARRGMSPNDSSRWGDFRDQMQSLAEMDPSVLADLAKVQSADLQKTILWAERKIELAEELEVELESQDPSEAGFDVADADRRVLDLVRKGASVGCFALAVATEGGRIDLLRELFAAGGDPGVLDPKGGTLFSEFDLRSLRPDALQVWLEAGACPINAGEVDCFGNVRQPTALFNYAWMGRTDLMKACRESSVEPISMTYEVDGKVYAPLLAIALDKGREEAAVWLVREMGCRLDHLDPASGKACRTFAKGDLLAEMEAAEFKIELEGSLKPGKVVPPKSWR
jgi:hypothetical protein